MKQTLTAYRFSLRCILTLLLLPTFLWNNDALSQENVVPGQFIMKFSEAASLQLRSQTRSALGLKFIARSPLTNSQLVEISSKKSFNKNLAKDLLAAGIIEYIEPNYIYTASSTPNDTSYSDLWGLNNSNDIDIDANHAWDTNTGSQEIVVGVVDTGIDYNHPDLAGNIWTNPGEVANGIDDDGNGIVDDLHGFNAAQNNGNPFDDNGHGTHVSGTIGAVGNNSLGVTGVAWKVKLMGLKFLNSSGSGTTQAAIDAINYAVTMKRKGINIRVLNNSWGGSGSSIALKDAISAAANEGILFAAAAGNSANDNDSSPTYPASYDLGNIISVAALDKNGNLATFSNYGQTSVDVAAPGVSILSTSPNAKYIKLDGTSMATPFVSGLAALLFSADNSLSAGAARVRIVNTTKPIATLNGLIVAPGIISATRALNNEQTPPPAPGSLLSYSKEATTFNFDKALGNKVQSQDDGYYVAKLDFSFPYFGETFKKIALSANGRIIPMRQGDATPTSTDFSNKISAGISPYNDDLYPSPFSDGGIYLKQSADKATITWIAVNYAHRNSSTSGPEITFQVDLYPSGAIEFHYKDTASGDSGFSYGASASVGLAPPSGVAGEKLTVSHNRANQTELGNGKSLKFSLKGSSSYTHADFDGDKISDIVVYRPSAGLWFILNSSNNFDMKAHSVYQLGLPGDVPRIGDFDGDKVADIAVWREASGTWFIRYSNNNYAEINSVQWGLPGDTPMVGDYDGDGVSDLGIYRTNAAAFYVLLSGNGFNRTEALGTLSAGTSNSASVAVVALGGPANDPVVGDFTGDGKSDFATIWQLVRFWTIKDSAGNLISSQPWGEPGDTPLACKWDSDNAADRVIVRVKEDMTLSWFVATSGGSVSAKTFGSLGDKPHCRADYDGDGVGDMRVFRESSGEWFIMNSKTSKLKQYQFGLPGDIPL